MAGKFCETSFQNAGYVNSYIIKTPPIIAVSHKEVSPEYWLAPSERENEKLHVMNIRHMELFACLRFISIAVFSDVRRMRSRPRRGRFQGFGGCPLTSGYALILVHTRIAISCSIHEMFYKSYCCCYSPTSEIFLQSVNLFLVKKWLPALFTALKEFQRKTSPSRGEAGFQNMRWG